MGRIRAAVANVFHEIGYSLSGKFQDNGARPKDGDTSMELKGLNITGLSHGTTNMKGRRSTISGPLAPETPAPVTRINSASQDSLDPTLLSRMDEPPKPPPRSLPRYNLRAPQLHEDAALHSNPVHDSPTPAPREPARFRNRSNSIDPFESSSRAAHDDVKWHGPLAPSKAPTEASELSMLTDLNQPEYQDIIREGELQTTQNIRTLHEQRMKARAQHLKHRDELKAFNRAFKEDERKEQARSARGKARVVVLPARPAASDVRDFARRKGPFEMATDFNASPAQPPLAHYLADMAASDSEMTSEGAHEDGESERVSQESTPRTSDPDSSGRWHRVRSRGP